MKALGGSHANAVLAFYFDKLSFDGIQAFLQTLEEEAAIKSQADYPEIPTVDFATGEVLSESIPSLENVVSGAEIPFAETIRCVQLVGTTAAIETYLQAAVQYKVRVLPINE